ncbi:hypothetical protein [Streptomyces sp. NPDC012825]|uniref:hypothetical protein n=1 Tax=Streptomyces sp. NPDC012825 TaxID=3364851 RepID=UPI0036992BA5
MRADRTAATPVIEHVRHLIAQRPHLPVAAIARYAGVASSTLKSLLRDTRHEKSQDQAQDRTVSPTIAQRLLSVRAVDLPCRDRGYGGRSTDATPAIRHVQTLLSAHPALSQAAVARAAGISPSTLAAALHDVTAGRPRRIQQAAAQRLLVLDPDLLLIAALTRRSDTTDLQQVIDHLHNLQLRYDRASRSFIARTAGVKPSTLSCALLDHVRNPRRGIYTAIAQRILALKDLPPPACPRRIQITDTGLLRRLQALCTAGWTLKNIGAAGGISAKTLTAFIGHPHSTPALRGAILAAWEELAHQPGPSPAARQRAQAKAWAPPLAWDNETIDDPATSPNGIRTPAHQSPWTPDLLHHELSFLTHLGLSKAQALKRLGLGTRRAHQILGHTALTVGKGPRSISM